MKKLSIIGNLGADAKIIELNGKRIARFPLAHNKKYKNAQGDYVEQTTWWECSLYAENKVVEYLKKGRKIYVDGEPIIELYERKNGEKDISLKLRVIGIDLI